MGLLRRIARLIQQTIQEWSEDRASRLAAALAYYTIFSLAPLLILILAISGFFWKRGAVETQLLARLQLMIGEQGVEFVRGLLESVSNPAEGITASILSTAILILGAIGVVSQLKGALNTIWEVEPPEIEGFWESIKFTFSNRLLAFLIVLLVGLLILVSVVASTVLSSLEGYLALLLPAPKPVMQGLDILITILLTAVLFSVLYKVLPDARVTWRDVWIGGLVTAILFSGGKFLIGWYLGNSTVGSSFGAAGSLVVILVWIYYSAQIFFLGAEFTQVYANHYGSQIRPEYEKTSQELLMPYSIGHDNELTIDASGTQGGLDGYRKRTSLISSGLRTLLYIFLAQVTAAFLLGYWESRTR